MLKVNSGALLARIISFAQSLVGQANSQIVHAGLMFDHRFIIEAQGPGLISNDLMVGDLPYGYLVFRATQESLAEGIGTCAKLMFDIQGQQRTLKYNFRGLPGAVFAPRGRPRSAAGMDQLLDDILSGRGHPFFCSQFVIFVIQFVAEQNGISASQIFDGNDARISPSRLASLLQANRWFEEVGYLLPYER